MVRSVTRQVESEWDDTGRALVQGLQLHDAQLHSQGCGLHPAILAEPDVYQFTYAEEHCPACEARARYMRILADQDAKWVESHKDTATPAMKRPSDGRRVLLKPKGPDPDDGGDA